MDPRLRGTNSNQGMILLCTTVKFKYQFRVLFRFKSYRFENQVPKQIVDKEKKITFHGNTTVEMQISSIKTKLLHLMKVKNKERK